MTASSLLFRLLLGLVVLAPIPLGANRPWAWSLMAVAVGGLLVAWAVLVALGRARAPVGLGRLWPVAVPFGLVLAWAFVQTSPLMPVDLHHPLWAEASAALGGTAVAGAITVDAAMTYTAILRLACYGGIFWLAVQLGRERARAHEASVAFCLAGGLYAAYGLAVHFAGLNVILWLPKWAYHSDLTSTFVNRNSYGAYAGLAMVYCAGVFVYVLRPSHGGRGRRMTDLAEAVIVRALPYLLGALVTGSALLLTHSRGALLATAAALVILLVLLMVAGVLRTRMALVIVGAILAVGLVALAVSGDRTLERLTEQTGPEHDAARAHVYGLTADAIADAPLTGSGLGAFLPAFRIYRDSLLSYPVSWDYAHNVHLELAMDLGIPAAAMLYVCLAVIVAVCVRGLMRRRRDQIHPAMAIAAAALLGLHGLIDFSVQMPAIAATLALLLGIGYAQSWSTAENADRPANGAP
ncbi:O-antigen ligase family protein [Azospirillum halopraeferens]|uniref:O-antigen ligase family protein n=1 Tax=Azospirillum halopraeferens TaxID=34010 RepID=UPI00040D068B|nr:O-antigen ligase family protein [Azospirillum halopraeferens]